VLFDYCLVIELEKKKKNQSSIFILFHFLAGKFVFVFSLIFEGLVHNISRQKIKMKKKMKKI